MFSPAVNHGSARVCVFDSLGVLVGFALSCPVNTFCCLTSRVTEELERIKFRRLLCSNPEIVYVCVRAEEREQRRKREKRAHCSAFPSVVNLSKIDNLFAKYSRFGPTVLTISNVRYAP